MFQDNQWMILSEKKLSKLASKFLGPKAHDLSSSVALSHLTSCFLIAWKCYANSTPLTFVFFFSILDLIVQIVIIHGHIYFVIIIFWAQAVTVMTKSPHGPALLQAACTKFKENKGKKNISLRLSTRTDYGGSSDYSEGNLRCKTLIF